jgi:acyl-CoA synthetase (AMP-forming)/AMP-acid ligase II
VPLDAVAELDRQPVGPVDGDVLHLESLLHAGILACPGLRYLAGVEFNLADLFEAVTDAVGEREAMVCAGGPGPTRRLTYRQLDDRADRLARVLVGEGIGVGDFVGLHLHNGPEFVEAMVALYKLRAVPVNVNFRYTADELAYLLHDGDVRAVLTDPDARPMVESLRPRLASLGAVIAVGEDYEARLAAAAPGRLAGPRSGDDLYVLYTGGTTGQPKGVVWRHEDIYFASLGGRGTPSQGVPGAVVPGDVVERALGHDPIRRRLPLCPLIHGGAMWIALQALLSGGTLVLDVDRSFDPVRALSVLATERVDLTMVIGDATARPLADAMGAEPDRWDLSSLQVIASGGAVLSPAVRDHLAELLPGVAVLDTFGSSESGGQGRLVSAAAGGPPRLLTDEWTAVLDDDLRPVPIGVVGRLARRGRIPLRYHGDTARSAATFPVLDGERWAVPGDLARLEADGTITVLGRGSTSINTGGEKVFPEEVEGVVKGHPAVFDCLVVGRPDERYGEQVVAVVALRPGVDVSDDELEARARRSLAGYKVPRAWVRVAECRRLPTGKPDYRWAREVARDPTAASPP